jgi:low temperature requirement protein LtrA
MPAGARVLGAAGGTSGSVVARMSASLRERWLRPPRLRTVGVEGEERHATWLELFFDLVFVICIAEVVHTLEDDRSLGEFLGMAGLFVPIWWAWLGFTVYADRFDTDDLLHRVLVLAGMLAVIAMALSVHDALHGGSAQFALAYAAVRTVVVALNARASRHAAPARPLLNLYVAAFTAGVALWLVSVLVPEPYRYLLWAAGMVVDLSAPWLGRMRMARAPIHASHITERYGLFTLIVIGESVISVAQGAAGVDWEPRTLAVAVVGFLAVACLWWIYFEYLGGLAVRSVLDGLSLTYAHLPLLAGLVSVAVGTELAVLQAAGGELERATAAALGGGTALYLLALTAIHATTGHAIGDRVLWLRLAAAVVALAIGALGPLGAPLGLIALLAALLVVHVAAEMALRQQAAAGQAPPEGSTATGPTLP